MAELTEQQIAIKMKVKCSTHFPFLSHLIFSRDIRFTDSEHTGTDGKNVYISRKMMKEHSKWESLLYAHEILHMAFDHLTRQKMMKARPAERLMYNVLTDYKINETLHREMKDNEGMDDFLKSGISQGSVKDVLSKMLDDTGNRLLSKMDLVNIDKSFVELREHMKKGKTKFQIVLGNGKNGQQFPQGSGLGEFDDETMKDPAFKEAMGRIIEGSDFGDAFNEETKDDISRKMQQAAVDSKMRGTKPGDMMDEINNIWSKNEVNWARMLSNRMKTRFRQRRTWKSLHRKSFYTPALVPGFKRKEKYKALVALDVSGSVNTEEIQKFFSEIRWLMHDVDAEIEVVTFDTEIHDKWELKNMKDMSKIKGIHGRGGTSFRSTVEYAIENKMKDLIIFTDGYGDNNDMDKIKGVKSLNLWWICDTKDIKWPVGNVVYVSRDNGGD